MNKRLISLLLVFVFTVQLPFLGYEKGKVYAAAALPVIAGASETIMSALCTAVACAGLVVTAKNTSGNLKDMTEEEQKAYYNSVAANNKEAIKKLYDDGYFANTGMEEVIGNMLSGDDTACAVSLKKVLEEKEMEEEKDIKTYESGKKDDNGKNKPLVAVSGRLLDLLVDVIGGAVGNMIEDKQSSSSGSDDDEVLIKALSTLPTAEQAEKDSERTPYSNYILFKAEPTMICDYGIIRKMSDSGYYMFWYNDMGNSGRIAEEYYNGVFKPYNRISVYLTFQFWNKNSHGIMYHFDESSEVWEVFAEQHGPGNSYGVPYLQVYDCRQNFKVKFNSATLKISRYVDVSKPTSSEKYDEVIAPNPLPDVSTIKPPTVTQIVNNYFGDEVTNFYEDIYNYNTTNNNNYFTENKYLLPTDPADVAKDIIVPAETTINNTYNNISPDVTVDQDYINNVVIPAIIAGINANLKLNTDVNMGDLTIDNVFDFSGDDPDDETFNKVTFHGLEKKFPFCLPFDVYYFLDALDAEPRAPAFTIVIPLHNFGFDDYSLKIDFSQFDPVFKVVRGCELFLACFGLVFITKKMIWK
nr:MAG TPA: hypothetical protein [Inoviridae sp.]